MTTERIGSTRLHLPWVDRVTADEIRQSVERFHQDFPLAGRALASVEIAGDEIPSTAYAATVSARNLPGSLDVPMCPCLPGDQYKIILNPRMYQDRECLLARCREDAEAGFHVVHRPESSVEHELGHVLDLHEGQSTSAEKPPSFERIQYLDALSVSGYGRSGGPHETFADAFAGWWSVDRIEPVSERVREAISLACRAGGYREELAAA